MRLLRTATFLAIAFCVFATVSWSTNANQQAQSPVKSMISALQKLDEEFDLDNRDFEISSSYRDKEWYIQVKFLPATPGQELFAMVSEDGEILYGEGF